MPVANKIKGYFNAFLSAFSFGLIPLFVIPIKNQGIPMDVTLFYRFFLAAIMIGAFLLMKKVSLKLSSTDLFKLAIMGAFEPVVAVFISVLLFGEKVTWNLVTGCILIFCALFLSVAGNRIKEKKRKVTTS